MKLFSITTMAIPAFWEYVITLHVFFGTFEGAKKYVHDRYSAKELYDVTIVEICPGCLRNLLSQERGENDR